MEKPEKIYLQWYGNYGSPEDGEPESLDDITWCVDKINENDILFVSQAYHKQEMAKKVVLDEEEVTKIVYENSNNFGKYELYKEKMPNATAMKEARKLAQAICSRTAEIVKT